MRRSKVGAEPAVRVELLEEATQDLAALARENREAALEAVRLLSELRVNPHLGERMRATPPRILEPCRKLYLGPPDRLGRPTLG